MGITVAVRVAGVTTEVVVAAGRCRLLSVRPDAALAGTLSLRNAPAAEIVGTPATPGHTPSESGGTLGAATYFARVQAVDIWGQLSTASAEVSDVIAGSAGQITYTWTAGTGATPVSYRVYFGTVTNNYSRYFTTTGLSLVVTANSGGTGHSGAASAATSGNQQLFSVSAAGLTQAGKKFHGATFDRGVVARLSNGADAALVIVERY